ncbi:MAG: DUF1178 family protein [Alphaproteobacteria bacterium]
MISFNLRCAKDHVFEAWFKDSASYDEQVKRKALSCPSCGGTTIEKGVMAPNISRGSGRRKSDNMPSPAQLRAALLELRTVVEKNCDYVGSEFPEEARKIHYGETDQRNIYGEATAEEATELAEEGIEFGRIPWVSSTDD